MKGYPCDWLHISVKGDFDNGVSFSHAKIISHENGYGADERISVRCFYEDMEFEKNEKFFRENNHKVIEVNWVPHDKEFSKEFEGEMKHIRYGENTLSFRVEAINDKRQRNT